jgi:MFS family permease
LKGKDDTSLDHEDKEDEDVVDQEDIDAEQTKDTTFGADSKSNSINWIYSIVPYTIAVGPIGTFVSIFLLTDLHSGLIVYSLIITLSNAIGIPAAIVWGFVADHYHKRKTIIVATYFSVTANLVAFLFIHTVAWTAILYTVFSFISAASATPLNLLIMETQTKSKWATGFARFSMMSSVGTTLGLVLSAVWTGLLFELTLLLLPLAILSIISAALSIWLIREPEYVFEREIITTERRSFYQRILAVPLMFIRIPRLSDFRSVFQGLRNELTSQIPILYLSIFFFYLASGIFNTSLTPSLLTAHASTAEVFSVSLTGMIVQTAAFYFAGHYIQRRTLKTTALGGLALRSLCYGLMGVSSLLVTGVAYLGSILVLYPIAAGIAYAAYYTASNVMIFNTLGHRSQASRLGVYSALVGIATTIGSIISGLTSFYIGYYATFILAGGCLACAAYLTSLISAERGTAIKIHAA